MNVKLLKNLAFLGLLSFSVFPSFALSKIIPDGTIPYNMGVQLKEGKTENDNKPKKAKFFKSFTFITKPIFMILLYT
jgi:hypothetical protein